MTDCGRLYKIFKFSFRDDVKGFLTVELVLFGLFHIISSILDVGTDIYSAVLFYVRNHVLWALATISFIFLPFFISLLQSFFNCPCLLNGRKKSEEIHIRGCNWMPKSVRHLPLVQIYVHFCFMLELKSALSIMKEQIQIYKRIKFNAISDDSREEKRKIVEKASADFHRAKLRYAAVLCEFQEMKLFETFGENAPQSALQIAIALKVGYLSRFQILTIATSLVNFAYGSTEIFLMMPTKSKKVRYAGWRDKFLVFPSMVLLVIPRIFSNSLMIAYLRHFSIIFPLAFVIVNFVIQGKFLLRDKKPAFLAIVTNLVSPCIILEEGSKFFLRTNITSTLLHVIGQIILYLLVLFKVIVPAIDKEPPVLHCYEPLSIDSFSTEFGLLRCPAQLLTPENEKLPIPLDKTLMNNCSSLFNPIESSEYMTLCDKVQWWLPLLIASGTVILMLIGSLSSTLSLHAIIDPAEKLLATSTTIWKLFRMKPIWNEDHSELLEPVLNFMKNPSHEKLQLCNKQLISTTGKDLSVWSVKYDFHKVMETIIDVDGLKLSENFLIFTCKEGSPTMIKCVLQSYIVQLSNDPWSCKGLSFTEEDMSKLFETVGKLRKMNEDFNREEVLNVLKSFLAVEDNYILRDLESDEVYNFQKACKRNFAHGFYDSAQLRMKNTMKCWLSVINTSQEKKSYFKKVIQSVADTKDEECMKVISELKQLKEVYRDVLEEALLNKDVQYIAFLIKFAHPEQLNWYIFYLSLSCDNVPIVSALYEKFANKKLFGNFGWSPLHVCSVHNYLSVARFLNTKDLEVNDRFDTSCHELATLFGHNRMKTDLWESSYYLFRSDERKPPIYSEKNVKEQCKTDFAEVRQNYLMQRKNTSMLWLRINRAVQTK